MDTLIYWRCRYGLGLFDSLFDLSNSLVMERTNYAVH